MWPNENPWPLIFVWGMLGTALFLMWHQRKQAKYLLGIILCIVLMIGTWFVEQSWVTSRERVEASVIEIVEAFQQRELERTVSYVSQQAPGLRLLIGTAMNLVEVDDDMRVSDVLVELLSQETRAKSRFRVNATVSTRVGSPYSQYQPTRWEATWQLEGGEWKMVDIIELDPITGEKLDRLDALRNMVRQGYGR